ncbi:MAG: methyl-accepting chemotaxis protein [Pseudomonadota bacterium]
MNWFINLATRTKLFLSFGLMVGFLLVVIGTAYRGLTTLRQSQEELFQNDFLSSVELVQLRSDQNRSRGQLLEIMMINDKNKRQELKLEIREKAKEIDAGMKLVAGSLKGKAEETKQFEEMVATIADYRKTREEELGFIDADRIAEAQQLAATIQDERYNRIRVLAQNLGDHVIERAKKRITETGVRTESLTRTFLLIGIVMLVLSAATVFFLNKIIARPLVELTCAARQIAQGDPAIAVQATDRRDEVGELTRAFAAMVGYLQAMASISRQVAGGDLTIRVQPVSERDILGNAFAGMVENLRSINKEMGNGVGVLASSASEILVSTTQIASGMVETASSVSETTATVEEVKQTAQLSAEKSRTVSDNAREMALVADQGSMAVAETMEGIEQIKELMETVVESVVMLSEQTQTIGEIITVVNDLAQQSNLLAVNAAIEASKAGEQGKGFAVVAQEIKSLADQSKQATEQVRTILADIQKATGKSVLAAEQVSKAVEGGVKQAAESGESIRMLAESIGGSSQAAAQIAASSQQQLVGMEQVAIAMESIKQAAQQNVAGTRQVEQAAHTLNELGQKLKEMIGRFRV